MENELDNIKKQIKLTTDNNGLINKFIVTDRIFYHYFSDIIAFLESSYKKDIEIYIQSRADILNFKFDEMKEILNRISDKNIKIYVYLVGFENFSQNILDILNKNITVGEIIRCIENLIYLEDRYPGTFLARTGSHGFIMFTPWTTLDDLKRNIHYIKKYDFRRFSSNYDERYLRLTPDIPLYYKAKEEGLIIDEKNYSGNAQKRGYVLDYKWKFIDKNVEKYSEYLKSRKTRSF